jgi:hypothetical protein
MLDFISLTVSNKSMFKKCFVSLLALWSWQNANAVPHGPFEFFNAQQETKESEICKEDAIKGMPPIRSQDSLPMCSSFSSAAVAQFQVCKRIPGSCVDGVPKSSKVTISPFSMLAWTRTNKGLGPENSNNYSNLQLSSKPGLTGGSTEALKNASMNFVFFAESCFPFDQFANKFGLYNFDKTEQIVKTIEDEYTKASLEGNGICESCLKGAALELGITSSMDDIRAKLVEAKKQDATPGQYLHKLMLEKCSDTVKFRPSQAPKFDSFPSDPADFTYDKWIGKVKDVLKSGNPLAFDGICLQQKEGKCVAPHSVAISGYRKVCKKVSDAKLLPSDGKSAKEVVKCSEECRDLVKVQNSWGAEWQDGDPKDLKSDGWVDAKVLADYATKNKDAMKNSLAWYY